LSSFSIFSEPQTDYLYVNDKSFIERDITKFIEVGVDGNQSWQSYKDFKANLVDAPLSGNHLNFGQSNQTFWIKLAIENTANNHYLRLAEPLIDHVDFFCVNENGLIKSVSTGAALPYDTREIKTNNYLFYLPKGRYSCFIKLRSNFNMQIPVSVGSIQDLMIEQHDTDFILSIYFGIMLVMIVYNFFVYLSLRDTAYLYYILYIFFVTLFYASLKGISFEYFWHDYPYLNYFIPSLASLCNIFVALFIIFLLQTRKNTPALSKWIWFFIFIFIVSIIINLLGNYDLSTKISQLFTAIFSLYLIFVGIRAYKKGVKVAKFFLFAWTLYIIAVIIFILKLNGIIVNNAFTNNSVLFGSALEALLLSFALADKINIYKKEKETEQQEKLEALEENKRIIINQKVILEQKVIEKTQELTSANEELKTTLTDLKSAQVSLVESEKMASLGQLTAGVAHEINNPINFVSSNVKPLIRDFQDLEEFMNAFKIQHNSEEGVDGEALIKLYRKLDLDYTLNEIGQLLSGVQEGANRTAEIVKGLKNFSRLDEAEFKTASIEEGLDSTLILLRSNLKGQIKIVKDYGKVPEIDCFAGKLNQVFMNLINNAIYAIFNNPYKPNDITGVISLTTRDLENTILVTIADNGSGMDEATLNKLFEPFFTTKPIGEGTGLGMSITYNIINDLHKGKLEIESKVNMGTKISIFLPKNLKK